MMKNIKNPILVIKIYGMFIPSGRYNTYLNSIRKLFLLLLTTDLPKLFLGKYNFKFLAWYFIPFTGHFKFSEFSPQLFSSRINLKNLENYWVSTNYRVSQQYLKIPAFPPKLL